MYWLSPVCCRLCRNLAAQPKFISGAAKETGFAERYSENVKEMKYEADFEELDIEFKPIVLETLVQFVAED